MSKFAYTAWTSSWSSSASTTRSTCFAACSSPSGTVCVGSIVSSADVMAMPAPSSAVRTACRSLGGVVTCHVSPWSAMSSAPASSAASIRSSSDAADFSTMITPLRSNCHTTAPGSAKLPPLRLKTFLISAPVRLRLSVSASTYSATPFGA